jgi:hypothetical protein
MTSELSFLIDLLLNHKLTKPTRDLIATRIQELGMTQSTTPKVQTSGFIQSPQNLIHGGSVQSPSTMAILNRTEETQPQPIQTIPVQAQTPTQPNTMAAAQALADRQNLMNQAMSGKNNGSNAAPKLHSATRKSN